MIIKNLNVKSFEEVNAVLKDIGQQALSKETMKNVQTVQGTVNTGDAATDTTINSLIENFNQLVNNIQNQ